jgi:hypothetical protein
MSRHAPRVVVVLGYSDGRHDELHPVCAARLARAAALARGDDVVVLSGWARVPGTRSEAELMAAAWTGTAREVVVDPVAQTTVGNAANALDDVRRIGAREVVVVTSRWHAPRAAAAFRLVVRGTGAKVAPAFPDEPRNLWATLRELPRWPLLPFQVGAARRARAQGGAGAAQAKAGVSRGGRGDTRARG